MKCYIVFAESKTNKGDKFLDLVYKDEQEALTYIEEEEKLNPQWIYTIRKRTIH